MCGICGIYNFNKNDIVKEGILKKMCSVLKHRGPDDEGYYLGRNVGFGHKRLSIIDIEGGHQPMSNEDSTIWIVQNGEIYNYLELRHCLSGGGHIFKTNSDTEVILHLYEEYGSGCVDRLNGMFAFAIWDKKKNLLFIARDRLGVKPLYYYLDKKSFIFASEIKAILSVKGIKSDVNYQGINEYLALQFCLGDKTLFKNIKKLLPGHRIVIKDTGIKIRKYWDLDFNIDSAHSEAYFSKRLSELIEDAVRLRLRSDVPVGAHLSGGIDSSIITCLASSLLNNRLKTFTGAFKEGREFNETLYARLVSKFSNTIHREVFITYKDFVRVFSRLIYLLDEPVAGPGIIPQYFVSEQARCHVKVVLGGQGGDELFAGYARYLIAYLEECIRGAIMETQKNRKFVVTFKSILPSLPQLRGYEPLMQYFWQDGLFENSDRRYFKLVRKDNGTEGLVSPELSRTEKGHSVFAEFQEIFNQPGLGSLINKMTNFDIKTLLPALLQVEDRTSMGVSLESRTPLLDYRIAELVVSMPPTIKFKNGQAKYILKQAVKQIIPKEILARKDKMGFPVPFSEWCRGPLKNFIKDILLDNKTKRRGLFNTKYIENYMDKERRYGRTIWGLLCLEMWFRIFLDDKI